MGPFAENLVKVLNGVNQCLDDQDVDSPLTNVRPVISVLLVVITGDRGLCGGYNSYVIKKAIADEIFSEFVSAEVDKVELLFTKFVSLLNSEPAVQTLLPMARSGELCDINGKCVDFAEDEVFRLTTDKGK